MIGVIAMAFAAPPAAPAEMPRVSLAEPIEQLMSPRTIQKVKLPGSMLLEWPGLTAPVGSIVDVWTKTSRGPCTPAQRLNVVAGPAAEGDLKHEAPLVRVTPVQAKALGALKYVGHTVRAPEDGRDYAELFCP